MAELIELEPTKARLELLAEVAAMRITDLGRVTPPRSEAKT